MTGGGETRNGDAVHPKRTVAAPWAAALAGLAAFAVFALTAYPTITWWDSSLYSYAAMTRGITTPPGSLLLTLLGWLITRLPLGLAPAQVLNLGAGALGALTVALVCATALGLLRQTARSHDGGGHATTAVAMLGAGLGAVTFGWGETLWRHAVMFNPYVLTAVFSAAILGIMLRWWERADQRDAWRWLLVLGVLFGVDFSVHRTNLLLVPGLFVWILVRHPRTLLSIRAWVAGGAGMIGGLAFHLLLMPLAAADPQLNVGDPSNWSRFYDYVSLKQYGGGWLVQLFPRRASLWSVQIMDVLRAFAANICHRGGPLGPFGLLPMVGGLFGLGIMWRRERRLALALLGLLGVHAAFTILYFNVPPHYFRPLHRHYLPLLVTCGVLVAYGTGAALVQLQRGLGKGGWRGVGVGLTVGLVALVPCAQLARNEKDIAGNHRYFTEDFATNLLQGLPHDAILLTNGDNDTWPLLYVQNVKRVRPDVTLVNLPLTNTAWYLAQLVRREAAFPLDGTPAGRGRLTARAWTEKTFTIPVDASPAAFTLPEDLALPDSITVTAQPTIGNAYVRGQDLVLLQILHKNRWRRPLCFSTTVSEQNLAWLLPYRRLDGLFWRIVPYADPPPNAAVLRRNLRETYVYRGYGDATLPLDEVSRHLGRNYYAPFLTLAQAEFAGGDPDGCRATRTLLLEVLPPARIWPAAVADSVIGTPCAETPHSR